MRNFEGAYRKYVPEKWRSRGAKKNNASRHFFDDHALPAAWLIYPHRRKLRSVAALDALILAYKKIS